MAGALVQALLALHAEAEAAGHGRKGAVYEAGARRLGMSRATLHKRIGEITMRKSRKQRSDAGRYTLPAEEARIISAYLMTHYRANDKKLSSIEETLTVLRRNGEVAAGRVDEETGEFLPLSVSAVSRALRHYGLHPEQLRAPRAAQAQRSLHPNDVWQIDASISVLYYVPEGGVADMAPGEYYKNKPGNFERIKRQRLTRFVVTDHTSSAIFAWYVAGGESIAAFAETLLEAMREKPGECLYGVPFHLMMDPGSGATRVFRRLLAGLEITPVIHAAGNPRAKGQVEQANNIVETSFEAGFKLAHVPSVAWINEQARRWCAWYNANKVLGRTGKTRLAKWMEITQKQLRLADVDVARQLLTREPETAKVDTFLRCRFGGRVWDVSGVPDVQIGERLALTVNPLDPGRAYVVTMLDGQEALLPVPEVAVDAHGFEASAALIGREMKRPADTRADTLRKDLERATMEAATDAEAAAKRKSKTLPFGGRIDPYKHLGDLPDVAILPRRGTAHGPRAERVVEPPLTLVEAAQRLRASLGARWTPGHYQVLGRRYPDGVPVAELESLMQEWSGRAAGAVSGGVE